MAQGVTSDKFLIQTMPCNPSFDPKAQKEEFRKQENSVRDDKLRVRLTDPRGHSRAVPDAAAAAGDKGRASPPSTPLARACRGFPPLISTPPCCPQAASSSSSWSCWFSRRSSTSCTGTSLSGRSR